MKQHRIGGLRVRCTFTLALAAFGFAPLWVSANADAQVALKGCTTTATITSPSLIDVAYWTTNANNDTQHLVAFDLSLLGGMVGTPPNGIMSQYYQSPGGTAPICSITDTYNLNQVSNIYPLTTLNLGAFTSPSPPPAGTKATSQTCANEKNFVDQQLAQGASNPDVVFVVQLGPGTAFGCLDSNDGCAYHKVTPHGNYYMILPYDNSLLSPCGVGGSQTDNLASAVRHEYAEIVTDPDQVSGWRDAAGKEIGDVCEAPFAYREIQFAPTGTIPTNRARIPAIWSNEAQQCVYTFSQDWANFFLGSDGQIWRESTFATSSSPWGRPNAPFASAPAVASWGRWRYDLFAFTTAGHLGHMFSSAQYGVVNSEDLGAAPAGAFQFKPAVTSYGNSRLDVFATTTTHNVYHRSWDNGTDSGWGSIGGPSGTTVASAPAALSGFTNGSVANVVVDVYVLGADGNVYKSSSIAGAQFGSWAKVGKPPGVTLTGNPAVVAPRPVDGAYLDDHLFFVNSSGSLSHYSAAGWDTWAGPAGTTLIGDPAATAMGDQRIFVNGVQPSGGFVEYWYDVPGLPGGPFALAVNGSFHPVGNASTVAPTPVNYP